MNLEELLHRFSQAVPRLIMNTVCKRVKVSRGVKGTVLLTTVVNRTVPLTSRGKSVVSGNIRACARNKGDAFKMTTNQLIQQGIGRRLVFLGRAADMVSMSLSMIEACPYEYDIHISAGCDICKNGVLMTCTDDIYLDEDIETSSELVFYTLFDKKIKQLMNTGEIFILQELGYDAQHCLYAKFSGALEIRSHPDENNTDDELWRIFYPWKAEPHLIATQKSVHLEQFDFVQETLDQRKVAWEEKRQKRLLQKQSQELNSVSRGRFS